MADISEITRRRFLEFAGGVLATGALVGCSAPAATPATPAKPTATVAATAKPASSTEVAKAATSAATSAAARPVAPKAAAGQLRAVEIRVEMFSGPQSEIHVRNAPRFTPYTQGKVKVVIDTLPRDTHNQVWLTKMQSRSSEWDCTHEPANRFGMSGPAGFFVPLSKFMNNKDLFDADAYDLNDFPKPELDNYRYNGELYILPQEMSALMFVYRKDLLAKWNIKEPGPDGYSWEELRQTLLAIQDKLKSEGKTDVYPLVCGGVASQAANLYLHSVWGTGHEPISDDGKVSLNDEKALKAVQFFADLLLKDKLISPGVIGYNLPEINTALTQGKAVMAIQWNAAAAEILDKAKSPLTAETAVYTVFPYWKDAGPKQSRVQAGVHGIGVSSFSKNPEEAFSYAVWFTSKETAREYVMQGGGSSGRQSLLSDPEILKKNPQYDALKRSGLVYHGIPKTEHFNYLQNSVLGPNMNAILAGKVTAKAGLDTMQADALAYLKERAG